MGAALFLRIVFVGQVAALIGALVTPANAAEPSRGRPSVPAVSKDWTGPYFGGHFGYAGGRANWMAVDAAATTTGGRLDFLKHYEFSRGAGSYLVGLQAGYTYMLPSGMVLGAEADVSFPNEIGGSRLLASP